MKELWCRVCHKDLPATEVVVRICPDCDRAQRAMERFWHPEWEVNRRANEKARRLRSRTKA